MSSLAAAICFSRRLSDHQLAHAVHEFVEPFGRHADGADGAAHPGGRRRRRQRGRLLNHRNSLTGAAVAWQHHDIGNAGDFGVQGDIGVQRIPRRDDALDLEFGVVEHEQEHLLDRGARLVRAQRHDPAEVAQAGIDILQRRHAIGLGVHGGRPERAKLVQQQQRIGAGGHRVGGQPEADAPGVCVGSA